MMNESARSSMGSHKLLTTDSRKITQICGNAQKSLQMVIAAMKLKDAYSLEVKL